MMDASRHSEQMSWQNTRWHVCLLNELLICANDLTSANDGVPGNHTCVEKLEQMY